MPYTKGKVAPYAPTFETCSKELDTQCTRAFEAGGGEAETIGQELENEMKRIRLGNLPVQAEAHRTEKSETRKASFFVPFGAD